MSRKRNVLAVPLTDEQAALLERVCADKFGGGVSKADLARFAVFNLYIPQLGYEAPEPMPRPQSERTAKSPKKSKRSGKRASKPVPPQTVLQRRATTDDGYFRPGQGWVTEDAPEKQKKFRPAAPAPTLDGTGGGMIQELDGSPVRVHHVSRTGGDEYPLGQFVEDLDTALGRR